jgi:DUF4097 and DUF4098 domain-containing protein YvlB
MNKKSPILAAVIALIAVAGFADPVTKVDRFSREFTLDVGGSFWIENPTGTIEIIGTDTPGLRVGCVKTVIADDPQSLVQGVEQTHVMMEGNQQVRIIKTVVPVVRAGKWRSSVAYTVRVPRSVHVKISTSSAERIRVQNITGNVTVKNFNGLIVFDNVAGSSIVDTVNGSIVYEYGAKPTANAQLSTVNGNIEVRVPGDSNFTWVADTIQGEFLTTMPVRGGFNGSTFRASVNSTGGPTLTTASLMGRVVLLRKGTRVEEARSVQQTPRVSLPIPSAGNTWETKFQAAKFDGNLVMSVPIGSIEVGRIEGFARVETGAGAVTLDSVLGEATVVSLGGPLSLGDIYRVLSAHTDAGDIIVRGALDGGNISTGGGTIRLLYSGGPTTLRSGGGDIIVRQASGPIDAETTSGDITITADPNAKTEKFEAKSLQGNVAVNVNPHFSADVEATIITSNPDANAIHSDFPGLTMHRDQINGKTRIRATGKINGGGQKLQLYATEGNIHITSQTANPITVVNP